MAQVERPLRLTFADLAGSARGGPGPRRLAVPSHAQGRRRDARRDPRTRPASCRSANYLTLHADRDDFHVSVPLEPLRGQGIVVYRLGPDRLGARARRPDPLPHPRPGRLPHRRARRLRQRQVPEPDRADRTARPRHAAGRRAVPRSPACGAARNALTFHAIWRRSRAVHGHRASSIN